ncbi:MAG: hypothetical protein WC956_09460 [bacterium]
MFKLIKWLIFLAIIGAVVLWFTGWKIRGKTLEEHAKPYLDTPMVKEGIRDIRSLVGEGLKAAGEAVSEDVTPDERKQLDDMVKKELMEGRPLQGAPGQQALPPEQKPGAAAGAQQPVQPRPSVDQMQVMKPPAPQPQVLPSTQQP